MILIIIFKQYKSEFSIEKKYNKESGRRRKARRTKSFRKYLLPFTSEDRAIAFTSCAWAHCARKGMEDSSPRSLITSKTARDGKSTDSLSQPLPRATYPLPPVKFPSFANTAQPQHVRPTFTLPELARELAPKSVFALDSARRSPLCYVYNENNELLVTSEHLKRQQVWIGCVRD